MIVRIKAADVSAMKMNLFLKKVVKNAILCAKAAMGRELNLVIAVLQELFGMIKDSVVVPLDKNSSMVHALMLLVQPFSKEMKLLIVLTVMIPIALLVIPLILRYVQAVNYHMQLILVMILAHVLKVALIMEVIV